MGRRKAATVLLTGSLVLSLIASGCSKAPSNAVDSKSGGTQSSNTSSNSADGKASDAKALEPATLKILWNHINPPITGVPSDPISKEITKLTGVTMDITPANAVGDVSAKIAAMLATGDLPDVVFFPTTDLMQKAMDAKALLPLDDLIDKYGPNLKKNVPAMLDYSKKFLSKGSKSQPDGKTYFLVPEVGTYGYDPSKPSMAPFIRWDLYKKLGYPKVDSLDDYIPILQDMMKLEPTNADGKKNYGIAANFADEIWNGDWMIWGAGGIFGLNANNYSSMNTAGNLEFQKMLTDPSSIFYKMIDFWNKANRAGVVDPDSFTMKNDNFTNKMTAGQEFMTFSSGQADNTNKGFGSRGVTDKGLEMLPPPKDADSYWVTTEQPAGTTTGGWAVSKNTKHPELAVKFLDFLASYEGAELLRSGIKGQQWDEENGKVVIKQEVLDQMKNDPDYGKKTGFGLYTDNVIILAANDIDPKYNMPVNFFNSKQVAQMKMNSLDKDMTSHYGVDIPMDLVTKNIKNYIVNMPEFALMPQPPQDLQDKANKIDTFVYNNYLKMILAKTDAAYKAEQDKFIKGVQSLGYDDVVKWYNDERQKALSQIKK